jgi:uncharacterized membrane protein YkoI
MRKAALIAITVVGIGLPLVAGTALATANDRRDRVAVPADGPAFDLEIDPDLDAQFGPRPINAVQAADIVTSRFGGRVVEAKLDEEDGRPIWEMELAGASVSKVDVDAINGTIINGGEDDNRDRDDLGGDDD